MALVKAGPKLGIVGSKALEELQYEVGFPHLARLVHLVKFIMDGAELGGEVVNVLTFGECKVVPSLHEVLEAGGSFGAIVDEEKFEGGFDGVMPFRDELSPRSRG